MQTPFIISTAIWFTDGKEYPHQPTNITRGIVITGRRHHNCFMTMKTLSGKLIDDWKGHVQGFITSDNKFVNRRQAAGIAYKAGQINEPTDRLFSEDLY